MATGSFSSVTESPSVNVTQGQRMAATVSGTFIATVYVDRQIGSAWELIGTLTAPGSVDSLTAGTYRLRCYKYASGTVNWSLVAESAPSVPMVVNYYTAWPGTRPDSNIVLAVGGVSAPSWLTASDVWLEAT